MFTKIHFTDNSALNKSWNNEQTAVQHSLTIDNIDNIIVIIKEMI